MTSPDRAAGRSSVPLLTRDELPSLPPVDPGSAEEQSIGRGPILRGDIGKDA